MTRFSQYLALIMATGALAWVYFDDRQTSVALGLILFAAFWAFGMSRRWMWASYLGLLLFTGAAAVGLWYDLSFGWLLAGVVGALLTYDLGDFNHRLRFAASTDNVQLMERAHLYRLGIFLFIGLVLSTVSLLIQLRFTFEWLAFLALTSAWGLSMLVGWLRRGGN